MFVLFLISSTIKTLYCPFRYLNEGSLRKLFYFFQLNKPNVSISSVSNQLVGLTDVKTGKPLYPGDLKLLVDVIGVLSQRGLGTSKNESSDSSQAFVKVSKDGVTDVFSNLFETERRGGYSGKVRGTRIRQLRHSWCTSPPPKKNPGSALGLGNRLNS